MEDGVGAGCRPRRHGPGEHEQQGAELKCQPQQHQPIGQGGQRPLAQPDLAAVGQGWADADGLAATAPIDPLDVDDEGDLDIPDFLK